MKILILEVKTENYIVEIANNPRRKRRPRVQKVMCAPFDMPMYGDAGFSCSSDAWEFIDEIVRSLHTQRTTVTALQNELNRLTAKKVEIPDK